MISALVRFVDALRAEGLSISPAEILDAGQALDLVGVESRSSVYSALKATLAKDRRANDVFDVVFDRFFTPPTPERGNRKPGESTGAFGRGRQRSGESPQPEPAIPKPRPEAQKGRARLSPRREQRVEEPANRAMNRMLERAERGEQRSGRLRRARLRASSFDPSRSGEPNRRQFRETMTTAEERRIAEEIPRIIDALRLGVGRRMQRVSSGRPWLRRALRQSMATGGVPFSIPERDLKRRRTRVVVLADVSFSVVRAAGLFMLLAASFLKLGRKNRALLFVDRPVDATDAIHRWTTHGAGAMPRSLGSSPPQKPGAGIVSNGVSFVELVSALKDLNPDAPSDYGTALHSLLTSRLRPRGRDTVLVILGDGRTNRFDPLAWALEELSRGCRAILWLVPEPRAQWGSGDSAIPVYLPAIDVIVEADNLDGLGRGLAELLRKL
jgi:uncharacterized protein with von Willebrand factor type A (vWA) domain